MLYIKVNDKIIKIYNPKKANEYEKAEQEKIPVEEKPAFHVAAPVGWINDPNGFSWYQGQIHLFYQYHPYTTEWGPMHWGHSVSDDMIHWKNMPSVLAPDQEYDKRGCFSGSATEKDGKQYSKKQLYKSVPHEIHLSFLAKDRIVSATS